MEQVKEALFRVGAGRYDGYDCCCWQVLGQGQFRPLEGSDPFVGEAGKVESVPEYRVEMLCADDLRTDVVAALKASHPYEVPAFDLTRVEV